ncbi:MAG: tetratricopeptide repeat protein [Candidatus Obscuribacterales bacterium]|jgi:tetratricopeptide (TPR) repeat protein|nr:tetratricopeptide repeat protein [Candidatus Obscuribacterales bacterium]
MNLSRLAFKTAMFCLISLASCQIALADDFPGVGSRSGWSEALPHYNVANKYMARGLYEQAAQHLEQAIGFYDKDPDFFVNYGVALRKLENYTGAEQAFKQAIALRENDWEAWSNLANAYLKQNRLQDTINCFNKAMKYNPPAAEKEAMLKDIADIKKILSMQAPAPGTSATATPASAKAGGYASAKTKNLAQQKRSATTNAPSQKASSAASTNQPSTGVNNKTPMTPQDKEQLKNSGWDWVY